MDIMEGLQGYFMLSRAVQQIPEFSGFLRSRGRQPIKNPCHPYLLSWSRRRGISGRLPWCTLMRLLMTSNGWLIVIATIPERKAGRNAALTQKQSRRTSSFMKRYVLQWKNVYSPSRARELPNPFEYYRIGLFISLWHSQKIVPEFTIYTLVFNSVKGASKSIAKNLAVSALNEYLQYLLIPAEN